ncbi:MAG: hypothetical protein GX298_07090 [Planctomycetes bacterium]|jgi:UDP-N-acetylglucosamine:LPS N-acetylglucosamine transferase|nr:hypothetical protein [Planctomycetota bacterium]
MKKPTNTKIKICAVASAGGHMSELLKLEEVCKSHNLFFVSTTDVIQKKLQKIARTYIVGECNREHPLLTLKVMVKGLWIIKKEKPDVILSTGAAVGFIMCFWGKLRGAKVIWVDSIANAEKLSLSGRMIRPFADLILSQWPDVAAHYANVEYAGELI